MEKWTQGPWHLNGAYSEMNAERPYDITAGACLIATTCPQAAQRYESLANARLITAAPQLAEAIAGILEDDDASTSLAVQRERWQDRMQAAKRALALARGEQ